MVRLRTRPVGLSPDLTPKDIEYAKFSTYAYITNDMRSVQDILDAEHPDWNCLHNGSDHSAFYNKVTRRAVYVAKGTDPKNMNDLNSDLKLTFKPIKKWNEIPRFKESLGQYIRWKQFVSDVYGINEVDVTGHSLGGSVALYLSDETGAHATVFNPGVPFIKNFRRYSIPNSRIVRTRNDIVSRGFRGVTGGERLVVPEGDGHIDPLSAHRMDHFTNEVVEPIPAVSSVTKGIEKAGVLVDPAFDMAEGNYRQAIQDLGVGGAFVSGPIGSYAGQTFVAAETAYGGYTDWKSGNKSRSVRKEVEAGVETAGMYGGLPGIIASDAAVGAVEYGIQAVDYKKKGDKTMAGVTGAESALLGLGILGTLVAAPELAIAAGIGFMGAHIAERSIRLRRKRRADDNGPEQPNPPDRSDPSRLGTHDDPIISDHRTSNSVQAPAGYRYIDGNSTPLFKSS